MKDKIIVATRKDVWNLVYDLAFLGFFMSFFAYFGACWENLDYSMNIYLFLTTLNLIGALICLGSFYPSMNRVFGGNKW